MKLKLLLPFVIVLLLGLMPVDRGLLQAQRCMQDQRACIPGQTRTDACRTILTMEPWRTDLWEALAEAHYDAGEYSAAVDAFAQAQALNVLTIRGKALYGSALEEDGQADAALAWRLALAQAGELPLDQYPLLAQQLLAALRVIDAESAAQAWLAADPANPHAHLNAGLLALLRSHEAGLALVEQAAALDAGLVPLARSLSAAVARAQLESDPAYQQLLLGREAANLGYPLIGELLCAQAVQINPAYAEAWALLGELQQRNGRGGLDALEQALALDPESTLVRSLLALYWQRRDDPAQAAAVFAQLAQEQPETALWQIEAGRATGQAGDIPAGLAQLVEASLAFPADLSVWTALAEYCALYQIELNTYGLTAAREALRLAPQDPAARSAMGAVLFSLGDLESAARYFQQVLDAQPEDTGALYRLGLIAAQQDRLDDARWYFSRVLELAPAYAELHTLAARSLDALGGS